MWRQLDERQQPVHHHLLWAASGTELNDDISVAMAVIHQSVVDDLVYGHTRFLADRRGHRQLSHHAYSWRNKHRCWVRFLDNQSVADWAKAYLRWRGLWRADLEEAIRYDANGEELIGVLTGRPVGRAIEMRPIILPGDLGSYLSAPPRGWQVPYEPNLMVVCGAGILWQCQTTQGDDSVTLSTDHLSPKQLLSPKFTRLCRPEGVLARRTTHGQE